ncbi:4-fold beta flower protein [Pseudarthrobacter sp. NPDC058119]|uniref:4-fold beta flower protein n=1 Tax=Pseudarthrobacter sp. NPDC058119 TaxID=3346348 RepID=UPI0036DDE3F8
MSSPLPRPMNRCRPPSAYSTEPERGNPRTHQQAEGPPATDLSRHPTHLYRPAAARQKPANLASEGRHHKLCQHVKAKTPLTRENVVPEVGLELPSCPCEHWEVPESCGIRPDPAHLLRGLKPKVWTMSTPQPGKDSCREASGSYPSYYVPVRRGARAWSRSARALKLYVPTTKVDGMEPIYNAHGAVIGWLDDDAIRSLDGAVVAWTKNGTLFDLRGSELGKFSNGFLRFEGAPFAFVRGAHSGPVLPVPSITPVRPVRHVSPVRPIFSIPSVPHVPSHSWSHRAAGDVVPGLR